MAKSSTILSYILIQIFNGGKVLSVEIMSSQILPDIVSQEREYLLNIKRKTFLQVSDFLIVPLKYLMSIYFTLFLYINFLIERKSPI